MKDDPIIIETNKKCFKCDNDAEYYIEIEKRIEPLNLTFLIDNDPLDKQFSSYQLCSDCAKKERWDVAEWENKKK